MAKRFFVIPLILLVGGISAVSCRREEVSKAEQFAEQLGRDVAVYAGETGEGKPSEILTLDLGSIERPAGPAEFTQLPHLPPVRQGRTGTCWSFATTSLIESEIRRTGKAEVKLSEMFTVYWEYVEKARRFIKTKGESFLGQGSESNSAIERMKTYGIVRESDYRGLPPGGTEHDHGQLFREFRNVLEDIRARGDWNEAAALARVRAILDAHLGRPPESIVVGGVRMTPLDYLRRELGIDPSEYVSFVSFLYLPFYTRGEFTVPDNWWHAADYGNLPLYEYYLAILRALRRGYSVVLAVDFTEPGYSGKHDISVIPSFDIPRNFIDQSSRELRFANGTTTDDHAVHCVGYKEIKGGNWFLIKDSWENAYEGTQKGYFFYRDDYLKLKCLMFMVHRDAVKEILDKFPPAG